MKKIFTFFIFLSFILSSVIYYGIVGEPLNLDPAVQWDNYSALIVANIYDRLIHVDPDTYALVPSLAEKWQNDSIKTRWIFFLRRGVKFQDGTELTAKAVELSFKRQLGKFLPARVLFPMIKDVRALDKYTVEFVLREPFSPFLYSLTTPQASIVSPQAISKGDLNKHPVGTGPYKLESWEKGKRLVLKRNLFYWKKMNGVEKIVFIKGESDALYNLFLAEKFDIIDSISLSKVMGLKFSQIFALYSKPIGAFTFFVFNPEDKWTRRREVREALARLWKPKWLRMVYGNHIKPIRRMISFFEKSKEEGDFFSPAKARSLLRKKGLAGRVRVSLVCHKSQLFLKVVKMYSSASRRAGIDLRIVPLGEKEYAERIKNRKYSLTVGSWILDFYDPDSLYYSLISKDVMEGGVPNIYPFRDGRLRRLIEKARRTLNIAERFNLYRQAEDLILQEHYLIPIYIDNFELFYNKRIKNIKVDPTGIVILSELRKNEE